MKIGILTFHRSFNYGAFMQCFSLVTRLKKDFPQITFEVIDYTNKSAYDSYSDSIAKKCDATKKLLSDRNNAFLGCQEELPLSEIKIISDDYSEALTHMNKNYDAVIVGSDAVWNWISRGFPNLYFLKDYKGKKLSYAASAHGLIYQNMTDEQKKYLNEAFSDFSYIGVRDVTTGNMVKFVNQGLTTNTNCDPTMFLNLDDVPCDLDKLKKKLESRGIDFSKPLIGLMAGNVIGKEVKEKYGDKIQLVAVYEPNKYADFYLNDLTPYEWAKVFSLFNVTLTHFFHGTMLSLVNRTPVIPIEIKQGFSVVNTTKIKDLMTKLELLDWREEIDWSDRRFHKRLLRKLGLEKNTKIWNSVFAKIDRFLENDLHDEIDIKVTKAAKSYLSFKEELIKITEEK